eukprot:TRINITY_DN7145_c1_g1_i4.p1 TRINITY_DN7145_c1_g1~~TRINITY_DN7145_c1_g1_i4.p1  ORF type:complete len:625 (+),score=109.64 TRINITY_DN7145_c1_g1_i4:64-1938(+)
MTRMRPQFCCCFPYCRFPVFVDFVTENTRSRWLNISIFLLIFMILVRVFYAFTGGLPYIPTPKEISQANIQFTSADLLMRLPSSENLITEQEVHQALFSIKMEAIQKRDMQKRDESRTVTDGPARQFGNGTDAEAFCIAFGIPILIGNSLWQHWLMGILSMLVLAVFGVDSILELHLRGFPPSAEHWFANPVDYIILFITCALYVAVFLAYLYTFVIAALHRETYEDKRRRDYFEAVRDLLRPTEIHNIAISVSANGYSPLVSKTEEYAIETHIELLTIKQRIMRPIRKIIAHLKKPRSSSVNKYLHYPQRMLIACIVSLFFSGALVGLSVVLGKLIALMVYPIAYAIWENPTAEILFSIVNYCAIGGGIACWLVTLINWLLMFRNYRDRIRNMRQGKYFFKRGQFSVVPSAKYIGYQICHIIIQFFALMFLFVGIAILAVLCYFIPAVKEWVIGLLKTSAISFVISWIVWRLIDWFLFSKHGGQMVDNPRLFSIFDYFYTFINVLTGLFACITRYMTAMGWMLVTFGRIDIPILNRSLEQFDGVYASYVGMVLVDHHYNNPVVRCAVDLFSGENFFHAITHHIRHSVTTEDHAIEKLPNSKQMETVFDASQQSIHTALPKTCN